VKPGYQKTVDEIAGRAWSKLDRDELPAVARAYYYFPAQFRETVAIACRTYPDDERLSELRDDECETDDLSPCPWIAEPGGTLNHDEFTRRTLAITG
jgi:hypothetical protein